MLFSSPKSDCFIAHPPYHPVCGTQRYQNSIGKWSPILCDLFTYVYINVLLGYVCVAWLRMCCLVTYVLCGYVCADWLCISGTNTAFQAQYTHVAMFPWQQVAAHSHVSTATGSRTCLCCVATCCPLSEVSTGWYKTFYWSFSLGFVQIEGSQHLIIRTYQQSLVDLTNVLLVLMDFPVLSHVSCDSYQWGFLSS